MIWMSWCAFCGDRTEERQDPHPRLCATCARIPGRTIASANGGSPARNLSLRTRLLSPLSYVRDRKFSRRF